MSTEVAVDAFCVVSRGVDTVVQQNKQDKLCGRRPQYAPAPVGVDLDLLTLKVVFESRVTWPTSVPILVFLGLSVLDLGPMYATDRHVRRASSLNAPTLGAGA